MSLNLLLLPLVGGYLFLYFFDLTESFVKRLQGYQLIIFSAIPATISLLISICITHFGSRFFYNVSRQWTTIVPFEYSGTVFIALIICVSTPFWLNGIIAEDFKVKSLVRLIYRDGNSFEILLTKAINEQKDVAITLSNHKVYIGMVGRLYNPFSEKEDFIEIIPWVSGYRDPVTKKLNLTTSYMDTYAKVKSDDLQVEDFAIVIPVSEILSANLFDIETYDRHFKHEVKN